MQWWWW